MDAVYIKQATNELVGKDSELWSLMDHTCPVSVVRVCFPPVLGNDYLYVYVILKMTD